MKNSLVVPRSTYQIEKWHLQLKFLTWTRVQVRKLIYLINKFSSCTHVCTRFGSQVFLDPDRRQTSRVYGIFKNETFSFLSNLKKISFIIKNLLICYSGNITAQTSQDAKLKVCQLQDKYCSVNMKDLLNKNKNFLLKI